MKKRQNSDDLELEGRQVINVDGLNFLKKADVCLLRVTRSCVGMN